MQSNSELDLARFRIFIRLFGLIDQVSTFDLIRKKFIPSHYNHMLRVIDHNVSKRRWPGFLTPFLLEGIEAEVKCPPSIVKHPIFLNRTETTDYRIGSSIVAHAGFPAASSPGKTDGIRDYVNASYEVLHLNGRLIFSANLWRPFSSKTMHQIVEPLRHAIYKTPPPLIFGKKKYFKEHILPTAIKIMIEQERYYSDLKIHKVFYYEENDEVNLLMKDLENFFLNFPHFSDIKYYY